MSPKTNDLISMIDFLPIDAKTALVEKILASLHPLQKEIDDAWTKKAEERISEIKSGKIQVIPGNEVFKEIEDNYNS